MRLDTSFLRFARSLLCLSLVLVPACGSTPAASPDAHTDGDAHVETDAHIAVDAHVEVDAHVDVDADLDAHVETDAAVSDAGAICAPVGIGAACDSEGSCQTGLRCYTGSTGDFCSVDRAPDCGGFVMARCAASAPYCLRPIGSSLGACATAEEAVCICAIAGDRIQAGEGTDGCPPPPRP